MRSSQEQFRLLVQGVTDYAIYLLDKNGRVSSWNMGAERIKGYAAHEIRFGSVNQHNWRPSLTSRSIETDSMHGLANIRCY